MTDDNPYSIPQSVPKKPKPHGYFTRPRTAIELGIIFALIVTMAGLLLSPLARRIPRDTIYRLDCSNHLTSLGRAIAEYEAEHGRLPPPYTIDANGRRLHSWRTLILPYLEGGKTIHDQIDFSKPWDHPVNVRVHNRMPGDFQCPGTRLAEKTTYVAIIAPGSCWRESDGVATSEITDGAARTLMLVELNWENAVHWMSPEDCDEIALKAMFESGEHPHNGGFNVLFADFHAHLMSPNLNDKTLRSIISMAGNEPFDDYEF